MNKFTKLALIFTTILTIVSTGCRKKEITEPKNYIVTEVDINGTTYSKIEGTIDESLSLVSGTNWLLSGGIFVNDGQILTIDKGLTIYADPDVTTFLSIKQGGKIHAEGTRSNPIVFTPLKDNPVPGDWGGIILNGKAKINTGLTAEGEGGTGIYGGEEDDDNSGLLRYVRVEYAGKVLGTDNELNGFSFNGVGSETTLEYLEAYKGADDGFEFFGGSANLKYAVSIDNGDDSFDWAHGWRGSGDYWYAKQLTQGDRGIEADNNSDNNEATPFSNPTLSNVTLIGFNDDGDNTGVRLREGTKGQISNILIYNFPKNGIRVSDQVTLDNMVSGELNVVNSNVYNNGTNYKDCDVFSLNVDSAAIGSGIDWMGNWVR